MFEKSWFKTKASLVTDPFVNNGKNSLFKPCLSVKYFCSKYIVQQKDSMRVDWRLSNRKTMRCNKMKPWCLEWRHLITVQPSVWDCCVPIQGSQAWPAYKTSVILPTFWFSRTWWQEVLTLPFSTCVPVMSINTTVLSYCSAHYILMT